MLLLLLVLRDALYVLKMLLSAVLSVVYAAVFLGVVFSLVRVLYYLCLSWWS